MEDQGYTAKTNRGGQAGFRCPFHEGPGSVDRNKSPNFYVAVESGLFMCHSASCGERGNLRSLERHFGVDQDEDWVQKVRSREEELILFERALTKAMRKPFYDQGLTDDTIERFRFGWDASKHRYVIPYLIGRRPQFFRYYQPKSTPGIDPERWEAKWKFTWEEGAQSTLFNSQDAMGDADGMVVVAEGEIKCALLVQMGYAAVAVPGAGQWKAEFQAAFTHARKIIVLFDNDNPIFHIYDKPGQKCRKCAEGGFPACIGHNPGQDAALSRIAQIGWRAKNVVLPLPNEETRKTDINEYFMRDGHTNADLVELFTGKRPGQFKVQSLAEIAEEPPERGVFLVEHGILPKGGRLLIAGKPKVGKSVFADNLALSLAAGIPFLNRFAIDHPTRTLLLDRELSKWSLFNRLNTLIEARPGYQVASENLLVDHDHLIRLDQPNAFDLLLQLVEQNGAEVLMLDTAYKFFSDVEKSSVLMKGFDVLDRLIHKTECSIVLTHHMRKSASQGGKVNTDIADPDSVAGSFLWTGWPNATVLLNFKDRSVENPFNAVATFTAFRDDAAPDPLALYRSRESIAYTAITDHVHTEGASSNDTVERRLTEQNLEQLLLDCCPVEEEAFLHSAAGFFGVRQDRVKSFFLLVMAKDGWVRKKAGRDYLITVRGVEETTSWNHEHNLPEDTYEQIAIS